MVREESLRQLDTVGKACEEYSGANFLQYAPAPRATKANPQPSKTHEPPPFSNMQVFFLKQSAEEHEVRRAGGDATATAERWVAQLVKAVGGSRSHKYAWMRAGVDLTPHGHTAHTLKHALGPFAESFVYAGTIRRKEKKEEAPVAAVAAGAGNEDKKKRGRPKKVRQDPPVSQAATQPVALSSEGAAAKKKSKK